ncbi:MAG: NUDIX hydrolase [Syntrophales bacterium]|nr:NUDIX hydrolase [Syntrophales bacterium]
MERREYPDRPVVGVGAVVFKDEKVLLVKRGVPPRKDLWAIPGGSVKLGETLKESAVREVWEETGITIEVGDIIYVFDLIERDKNGKICYHFVVIDFLARYISGEVKSGDDASEARWISREECLHLPLSENTEKLLRKQGFIS